MTHYNCPKTWLSAITTWQEHWYNHISISAQTNASQTIYHYVFPFTPAYFSVSTFTSLPTNNIVLMDLLMTGPTLLPVFLMWALSTGENHILPEMMAWRTLLQDLAIASGYGGGVFPLPITLSHDIKQSLMTFPVAGSFSDGCTSTHCTSRTLLVWM